MVMDNRNNINYWFQMGIEHCSPVFSWPTHPNLLLTRTLSLYILCHRTFPFASVIIAAATTRHLTTKHNYGFIITCCTNDLWARFFLQDPLFLVELVFHKQTNPLQNIIHVTLFKLLNTSSKNIKSFKKHFSWEFFDMEIFYITKNILSLT